MIELTQKVKLSMDSEKEIEQSVTYDPEDNWICVGNDANEISLSVENWLKLIELSRKVIDSKE